jgi:hypothetical protein
VSVLDAEPSVTRIALDGWRLSFRALVALPRLALSAFVLILLCTIAFEHDHPDPMPLDWSGVRLNFATAAEQVVLACILASVLIAVHRFIILDERIDRSVWRLPPIYPRFLAYFLLLQCLGLPALLLFAVIGPDFFGLLVVLVIPYWLFNIFVIFRTMLLFPALAIGAPAASWRCAWLDSRGYTLRFLLTSIVAMLPLILIEVIPQLVYRFRSMPHQLQTVSGSVVWLIEYVVGAVIASRFFQIYADKLTELPIAPAAPGQERRAAI